jgi:hypothetical protein
VGPPGQREKNGRASSSGWEVGGWAGRSPREKKKSQRKGGERENQAGLQEWEGKEKIGPRGLGNRERLGLLGWAAFSFSLFLFFSFSNNSILLESKWDLNSTPTIQPKKRNAPA